MNVETMIKEVLRELSGIESIENNFRLQEELALDSLSMVTLLLEVEEKFCIELKEADMNPFDLTTVLDVINLVKKYKEKENEE